MKSLRSVALLVFPALVLLAPPRTGAVLPSGSDVTVLDAKFGLVVETGFFEEEVRPTTEVPLVEGTVFGWELRLDSGDRPVHWREELELPAAPTRWGGEELGSFRVTPDRRTSILDRTSRPHHGVLRHAWSVAPGDPAGRYVLRVFVDGVPVQSFEFWVH